MDTTEQRLIKAEELLDANRAEYFLLKELITNLRNQVILAQYVKNSNAGKSA
jgi:hypothetical protein